MKDISSLPLVSVYCMTYNQKSTIAQAIEGVLQQNTDFPFELIIHDDASTDGTTAIVREYAARYPEIIRPIYQTENQYRRCNLIRTYIHPASRGQYIALCEGDDYWSSPDKLQMQVDCMRRDPDCTLCFHAVQQLSQDGALMHYRPLKRDSVVSADLMIRRGGLFCPTVSSMFRRDVMDAWPDFREKADVYDYPTQILAAHMGTVRYIDRMLAVYRFAFAGSWTAQHAHVMDFAHIENEREWLEAFDAYSGGKYAASIRYHMAHMWVTEYRKSLASSVRKTAREHVKTLPLKDRFVFDGMLFFFGVFGKHANKWFQMLKKLILR